MKCQAWVDPRKFKRNKKQRPTPTAAIGLDVLDWDYHCNPKNIGKGSAKRMEVLRTVAIRCGGPIEVSVYGGDSEYGGAAVEIDYTCAWCGQETKPVNLPKDEEELQADLQAMVDAREFSQEQP